MEFLIIGGTGFIGSNLVHYLVAKGYAVKIYHRKESSLHNLKDVRFKQVVGELSDEDSLLRAMEDCSGVYNLAACGSSLRRDRELRQRVNVDAAGKIARSARKVGGIRLVHVSSVAAIGTPAPGEVADETFKFNRHRDHYACSKYMGEQAVLEQSEQGLDAVIACPGNVVGCHGMKEAQLKNFRKIADGKMKAYPPGGVCVTNVDDLVRGFVQCFKKGVSGRRYILGGHNVSFKEYFSEIALATNSVLPKIRLPRILLSVMGICVETLFGLLGKEPFITKDTCDMISRDLFYSSDLAIRELGYNIGSLREAIAKASRALESEDKC